MGKRILITGAAGFLGTHLTNALSERGDDVFALYRAVRPHPLQFSQPEKLTQLMGDAQNLDLVKRILAEYTIDAVVHLAAQTQVSVGLSNPGSVIMENINSTIAVLEAARLVGTKRVIIAATDKVYGELDENALTGYREWMPLKERTPYGVSKACADMIAETYQRSFGMSIAVTRCGNLYGPGHLNWSTLIPGTIRRIFNKEEPVVRFGGKATRDFLYVSDAVAAYMNLIDRHEKGAYNFSGGEPLPIIDIVGKIAQIMAPDGFTRVKIEGDSVGEIKSQSLNCSLAKDLLEWAPKVSIEQGLKETVAWYTNYLKTV